MLAVAAALTNMFPVKFHATTIGGGYFTVPGIEILIGNFNFLNIFITFAYCIIASTVGAAIQLSIFPRLVHSAQYKLLLPISGFLTGYLLFVASNRILSLFPGKNLSQIAILIFIISSFIASIRYLVNLRIWNERSATLKSLGISIFLMLLTLIFGIQSQQSKVIGDAAGITINNLFNFSQNPEISFPIIGQHYDETSFLLPISWVMEGKQPGVLTWFLLMYSFGKLSSIAIIYLAIRKNTNNSLFSALLVACLYLTSCSPSPFGLPLLFDAGPSLGLNLHIGRIIIVTLAVALFTNVTHPIKIQSSPSTRNIILLVSLGVGLSAISPSSIWILVGVIGYFLMKNNSQTNWRLQNLYLLILPLVMVLTIPNPNFQKNIALGIYLFIGSGIFIFTVLKKCRQKNLKKLWSENITKYSSFLLVFAGLIFGFIFLGNSFTPTFYQILGIQIPIVKPGDIKADINFFGINPFVSSFPFEHQQSVMGLMYFFGSALFLIALSAAINSKGTINNSQSKLFQSLFVISLLFGISFFIWDYMNSGTTGLNPWLSIWVKSRLIEPYYYSVLCVTGIIVFNFFEAKKKFFQMNVASLFLAFYLMIALFAPLPGGMLGQLIFNALQISIFARFTILA